MSLDVGSVKGSIVVGDEFSATFAALDSKIAKLQSDFDQLSAKAKEHSTKTKIEVDKVKDSYNKLAASLDPVIAGEQKLERAHGTLDAALKKGIISQQQHNDLLSKAKTKYEEAGNPLSLLKGRVSELSEVIARFGGEAGEGLAKVSTGLSELVAKGSLLGPVAAGLAAVVAVAIAASIGIKAFDWLKEITQEGIKTDTIIEGLNATLRANGSAAKFSAHELVGYADALSVATGKSKEDIISTETILSRFDKLGHSTLPTVIKLTLDYAQAKSLETGTNVAASSVAAQVGAIYEGNAKSLTKFKDIGIILLPSQKATLQAMLENGQMAEYQAKVTEILTEKIGGLALAHANTLAGGIEKSKNEYSLFKETVASEILPAFKVVFDDLLKQAGGWGDLHVKVQLFAREIGDTVREWVLGLVISYHEAIINQDNLALAFDKTVNHILSRLLEFADVASSIPGVGTAWKGLSDVFAAGANKSAYWIFQDTKSLDENTLARSVALEALQKHSLALEGDEEVMKHNGSAIDGIAHKIKDHVTVLIDFEKQLRAVTEAMNANLLKSDQSASDQERLLKASLEGVRAYEVTKLAIEAETKSRAEQAEVTKELNKIKDIELDALKKLDDALKNGKVSAASYAEQQSQIELRAKAATAAIENSSAVIELNNLKIGLARAGTSAWLEISKNLTAQNEAMGKGIGEVTRQIIDLQKALDKQVNIKVAEFTDWQTQSEFASQYGKDLESIYEKFGLLSQATEALAVDERVLAAQQAAIAKNPLVSDDQLARIRDIIVANQQAIDTVKAQWAAADIQKWVTQPILDGVAQYKQAGIDAFNSWLETGKFDIDSLKKTFLDITIKMIEEWLLRWYAAISARTAADIAGTQAAGAAGGGGSYISSIGGLSGFGGGGATGGASSLSTAGGASWGTAAGYAFLAYVGLNIVQGFIGQNQHTSSGRATLGSDGTVIEQGGNRKLADQVGAALRDLISQVNDLATQWHLGLVKLTENSVTIERRSDGAIIVHTLIDTAGKVFSSMAEALDYAKVQALKFAQYSSNVSELVVAALHDSSATTLAGLQADEEFANRLATQNMPDIGKQIVDLTQKFVDDFQHAMALFGKIGYHGSGDLSQLGAATTSVILNFTNSLQALYDQLTGHKEDAKQVAEQQRAAYNAQRAITIAQITLLYEQIKAEIALYQVELARGTYTGGRGIGSGTGGTPHTSPGPGSEGGPIGFGKEGGRLPVPTPDSRNPTNDPQLAALLTVLDNLARALQGLPSEIGPGGVHAGGSGKGGGGSATTLSDLQKMIDDVNRSIAQSKLSDLAKQISDINKKWDDVISKLGGNSNALARINKVHDEAIKAANGNKDAIDKANEAYRRQIDHLGRTKEALDKANAARAAEIALARQQATDKLKEGLRAYTTEFGMSDWQKKQAANERQHQQDIKDQVGTGVPKWQVELANRNRQIELVGEAIGSLNLPIEGTIASGKKLGDTVSFLRSSMADGSLSVDKFNSVFAELVNQSKLDLLSLAEQIAQSTGDATKAAEIKAKMDEINFAIQRAQFNILLDQYEVLGTITGADKEYMEGLRTWINGLHPDFTASAQTGNTTSDLSSSASTIASASTTFQSAVDQFKQATASLLQSFNSIFGSTNQLGGSAQDRLTVAQQQFQSIERGALAGDVTARGQYGAAAENYLSVLNEANAGGALFGSERDRLRMEFEQLLAMTRFTLNGVTYDSGLGAPITPVNVGGQPNVGGSLGPVVGGSSGTLSSDTTGLLQQILTALLTGNANTTPVLNSISNNTAGATTSTQTVNANLDRLIAAVYQWLNAA